MKKETGKALPLKIFPLALVACVYAAASPLALVSCGNAAGVPENGGNPGAPAAAEHDGETSPESGTPGAVLVRGNYWETGIPGFGPNGFPALTGEYRLDGFSGGPSAEGETVFQVYLTRTPLYFSGEWQAGPEAGAIQVFRKESAGALIAAVPLDGGQGSFWTAVFRFPRGFRTAGPGDAGFNAILQAWARRFNYFLSFSRTQGELSLPAVLEF